MQSIIAKFTTFFLMFSVLINSLFLGTLGTEDKTYVTAPGEILAAGTQYVQYGGLTEIADRPGTFERIDYSTDAYDNGVTYEKYVNVYLPYGYDADDAETKYDVMYYAHGNQGSPEDFTSAYRKNCLDNLFAVQNVKPTILVFVSYYMDLENDQLRRSMKGDVLAGDGNDTRLPGNFWREMVEDIIPAVESKYHTYADSFDLNGISQSRAHRGFSGYSRGSVCTWYMFRHALQYFQWFAPMSCPTLAEKRTDDPLTVEQAYQYLKEAVDENPGLPFFIYGACGSDRDTPQMSTQIAYFEAQTETFSYGNDPAVNNLYHIVSKYTHNISYVPYYFSNSLQVLFH